MIEIHLVLHQLKDVIDVQNDSLKKRKEISIQKNDTQYEELDTGGLFDEGNPSEYDGTIAYMMEKNNALTEEIRNLKREREIQLVRLCEEIELRKKAKEERIMIDEDKKSLTNRLEERTSDV